MQYFPSPVLRHTQSGQVLFCLIPDQLSKSVQEYQSMLYLLEQQIKCNKICAMQTTPFVSYSKHIQVTWPWITRHRIHTPLNLYCTFTCLAKLFWCKIRARKKLFSLSLPTNTRTLAQTSCAAQRKTCWRRKTNCAGSCNQVTQCWKTTCSTRY